MKKTFIFQKSGAVTFLILSIFYFLLISAAASAQNIWIQKADCPGGSSDGAVAIGSKGYAIDGINLYEYDPGNNTWTAKASCPGAIRSEWSTFSVGNKGYFGLGDTNNVALTDLWEYDPSNDTWTQKASFTSTPRFIACSFAIGSKGYICGGYDGTMGYKDLWEYDPGANTWTQKADFGGGFRAAATGIAINGKGYVGLGASAAVVDSMKVDFWEYDPGSNTWTQKAPFPGLKRVNATGFGIGTRGFIGTGSGAIMGSGSNYNDIWEYNPGNNTWTQRADYAGAGKRHCHAFAIGTKGYLGWGEDTSGPNLNDFWEYSPLPVAVKNVSTPDASFTVFPNPNDGDFAVRYTVDKGDDAQFVICDVTGKILSIYNMEATQQQLKVNRSGIEAGIYFYKVVVNNIVAYNGSIVIQQ